MDESGFTLIEVLIVVGILAVLMVILLPSFSGATRDTNRRAAQLHAQSVRLALNTHLAVNPQLSSASLGTVDCAGAGTMNGTNLVAGNTGNGWEAGPAGATCTAVPLATRTVRVTVRTSGGQEVTAP